MNDLCTLKRVLILTVPKYAANINFIIIDLVETAKKLKTTIKLSQKHNK